MSRDFAATNREFYDAFWAQTHLERPNRFNTWPLISGLLGSAPQRLEIGPGLRPRLPIAGTHFVDISALVIERLNARGGLAVAGKITALAHADAQFDLVAAFDVIEHVEDDHQVFRELSRVLKDDGVLIFAVPLHAEFWTEFDDYVGHVRRYQSEDLLALLAANHLEVEQSAVYGMQTNNPRLLKIGVRWLNEHRAAAMRWYNWIFMPLGMFFQKRLKFVRGLLDTNGVPEIVLVCRRLARA